MTRLEEEISQTKAEMRQAHEQQLAIFDKALEQHRPGSHDFARLSGLLAGLTSKLDALERLREV